VNQQQAGAVSPFLHVPRYRAAPDETAHGLAWSRLAFIDIARSGITWSGLTWSGIAWSGIT
jgi:hypothetical protein